MFNLKLEERNRLINEIQFFFENERDEKLGIIAAGEILDFFLDNLGTKIYNKSVDDARVWISNKFLDVEADMDMLYK